MTSKSLKPLMYSRRWLLQEWLSVLALLLWAVLFLSYWLGDRLALLIHPNYFPLAIAAGFLLLICGLWQTVRLWRRQVVPVQHVSLLPPLFTTSVLLGAAVIGLLITPQPFNSQTAEHRGLNEGLTVTRNRPESFRASQRPEDRSLIDWIRTLDVYPEPDAYNDLPANIEGFAVHSSNLPPNYFTLTRFVLTCCAADAYPVGLPVKIDGDRSAYTKDKWFRVQGRMMTETLAGRRQMVLRAETITPIDTPSNPFAY
ncbi:TIGR03943 family protein [Candidatus Synechococcus calcipolaris G9]|uniref:TIGR03943 family protein n=1 Tax=Candidatus Synechococcus calcipolaris G9 TaxID=1497997 RepID=A0ABT6EWX8_9SYNE|nr:TIGR03943 family protein [Candidatus Synechococcus calcipolaris]MDG2990285.1 TIGR03943 family protein [Candidatus Synechococcus calcipolaris G9]